MKRQDLSRIPLFFTLTVKLENGNESENVLISFGELSPRKHKSKNDAASVMSGGLVKRNKS